MDAELTVRPARPDDRPDVERICAHTWEWGDYIPEVWNDWLADEALSRAEGGSGLGQVIVGQVGKRVVALSKITFHTPDQVWLEGMRVEADFRRQGIASRFLQYSLAYARERGARVVRLGTGHHNTPVHALAARVGMVRVGTYVVWTAEPLADGPQPTMLNRDQTSAVRAFVQASPVWDHTHGLYSLDWAWQELSAERLAQFLDSGQMMARLAPGGGLLALALAVNEPTDEEMSIGFADGRPAAVTTLLRALRAHAAQACAQKLRVMLPNLDWLRDAFHGAGYGPGDWQGELWVFERRLAQNGGGGDGG
jgi:GNAT superfamily N-acetyltransferase